MSDAKPPIPEKLNVRDEIAMEVMRASITRPFTGANRRREIENIAWEAYALADAMLEARNRR